MSFVYECCNSVVAYSLLGVRLFVQSEMAHASIYYY